MAANIGRAGRDLSPAYPEDSIPWPDAEQSFNLSELIAQCAFDWSRHTRDKGLALVSHTGEFPRGDLVGRPRTLRAALDIMLNNAVRFTDVGSVSLNCEIGAIDGNSLQATFRVGDTGQGFDQTERHVLLSEPGLARLQELVAGMGGRFDAESTPGHGTLAWFTVPLRFHQCRDLAIDVGPAPLPGGLDALLSGRARSVAADAVQSAELQQSQPTGNEAQVPAFAPGARRARVLLVDDTLMNQTVISALLLRSGFRLDVVDSGAAALRATATEAYDLILMDLHMPGMTGFEATRRIRERGGPSGRIPIVALSADLQPETLAAAKDIGMAGFIAKPVDRRGLIEGVQRALDEATERRQAI